MPRRDGTGPFGEGKLTGKRNGWCTGNSLERRDTETRRCQGRKFGIRNGVCDGTGPVGKADGTGRFR